jgi:hypothetical protein
MRASEAHSIVGAESEKGRWVNRMTNQNQMHELRNDIEVLFGKSLKEVKAPGTQNVETPEKAAAYILSSIVSGVRGTGLSDDPHKDKLGAKIDAASLYKEIALWCLAKQV